MGKSTVSMAVFKSFLLAYQRLASAGMGGLHYMSACPAMFDERKADSNRQTEKWNLDKHYDSLMCLFDMCLFIQ